MKGDNINKSEVGMSKSLIDLVDSQANGSNEYDTELGFIFQYQPDPSRPFGGPINKNPVNPKGRTILSAIEALRQAGFNTSEIRLSPQPCDSQGKELPTVSEDELRRYQDFEYPAFALIMNGNRDIVSVILNRQSIYVGNSEIPGFEYKIRYRKVGSQPPQSIKQLLDIVRGNAFPYKGGVDYGRINPKCLPKRTK